MKAKIFVGPRDSGKSRVAEMIAEYVGVSKTLTINGRGRLFDDPFLFHGMTAHTELIIIDDVDIDFEYMHLYDTYYEGREGEELLFRIQCNTMGGRKANFLIPQIIITTQKLNACWDGASFTERFEVINFPLSKTL